METATAVRQDSIAYNNAVVSVKPRNDIRKDAPRYVGNLGDFIEPKDKLALASIGSRSGGLRIGPSETEGCPTMWRTNYIIRRACFTPLELWTVLAKADIKNKDIEQNQIVIEGDAAATAALAKERNRTVYPGDDMQLLLDDSYRAQGIVEFTSLRDVIWTDGIAQKLNQRFFPDLPKWLIGEEAFPELLSDYETYIRAATVDSDQTAELQSQWLESGRLFRVYADRQIETNRSRIEATRAVDMGGFSYKWEERTRLFARQLGRTLEKEDDIRETVTVRGEDADMKRREVEAREKANEIELEKLALMRGEYAPAPKGAQMVISQSIVPLEQTLGPATPKCGGITANGEQCKMNATQDGYCAKHHPLKEEAEE